MQPTCEGFHVLKVPLHSSMQGLCVPFNSVIICAAPVGTGLAGLLPSLDLVASNIDGPMHMGQAVHQCTIVFARDGVPAVHHSIAAADQPPARGLWAGQKGPRLMLMEGADMYWPCYLCRQQQHLCWLRAGCRGHAWRCCM